MLFVGGASNFVTPHEAETEELHAHAEKLKMDLQTLVKTSQANAASDSELITTITDTAMREAVLEWRRKA